ncbi:uridine kinase [Spirochaetia bacterium]|nr:uridine kinase [Spirochaetia bacterium]
MAKINLTFADSGKTLVCEAGTKISDVLNNFGASVPLVAVKANNQLVPLTDTLGVNTILEAVPLGSDTGLQIYKRTLMFLFTFAAHNVLPDRKVFIGHSLGSAYFYNLIGAKKISEGEAALLKNEMLRLIKEDLAITFKRITFREALDYFTKCDRPETTVLLEQRSRANVSVNVCRNIDNKNCNGNKEYIDLYIWPLLTSTGMIKAFDVVKYESGVLLRYPAKENINEVGEFSDLGNFIDSKKIFSVYTENKNWGRTVNIYSVCQLNRLVTDRSVKDFISINEAFQAKKLSNIADKISQKKDKIKLILIAGPSSSGKTTTAKRLLIQLKVVGIDPIPVSLDDYYLHPSKAPKDENGKPDLECLEALDVPYLNKQLIALFNGEAITLPRFDFKTGVRMEGERIKLGKHQVLVLEGIHGLNDNLTSQIAVDNKFKIYVSALTQLNIDEHNNISSTDNRILRRMVRDNQFRGTSAAKTIDMWPSVQDGAEKHIFKFQNNADAVFNSALDYEIAVLKYYADPLLRGVKPDTPEYAEASRLLYFLENFAPIPPQYVPGDSILREFIGESDFKY